MGFKNILIIGMGFMGVALAKAIKSLKNDDKVIGFDLDKTLLNILLKENIIDNCINNLENLDNIDIIFLATPTSKFIDILSKIKDKLNNQIIIDIGSIKNKVFSDVKNLLKDKINLYIPTHPIVGGRSLDHQNIETEIKRIPNNLFKNNLMHFFPSISNEKNFIIVKELFENLEVKINIKLTIEEHDRIYGLISHLPMFLSIIFLMSFKGNRKIYSYFVDKFNDAMWIPIFFDNIGNIEFWVDEVEKSIKSNFINQNDLSKVFLNIIKINNFFEFEGKGCKVFVEQNDDDILISKKDFINSKQELISVCKDRNLEGLNNILLNLQ